MSDRKLYKKSCNHEFYPSDVEKLVDDVIMAASEQRKIALIKSFLNETTQILNATDINSNRQLLQTMQKITRIFNDDVGEGA